MMDQIIIGMTINGAADTPVTVGGPVLALPVDTFDRATMPPPAEAPIAFVRLSDLPADRLRVWDALPPNRTMLRGFQRAWTESTARHLLDALRHVRSLSRSLAGDGR